MSFQKNRFWLVCFIVLLLVSCFLLLKNKVRAPSFIIKQVTKSSSGFNKQAHSTSDPSSIWVVVNKRRPLPSSYTPSPVRTPRVPVRGGSGNDDETLLRDDAATAVEQLVEAGKKAGHNLVLISGYRSYKLQQIVYESYVKTQGKQEADKTSARAGHSEHQTGLAADFASSDGKCQIEECFADTPAAAWLNQHAAEYGFVLRYKKGTKAIVGYNFEPWHFRFVGKDLAQEVGKSGQTLEEFFNLPAAPDY